MLKVVAVNQQMEEIQDAVLCNTTDMRTMRRNLISFLYGGNILKNLVVCYCSTISIRKANS